MSDLAIAEDCGVVSRQNVVNCCLGTGSVHCLLTDIVQHAVKLP
jgi:hypothetical protein